MHCADSLPHLVKAKNTLSLHFSAIFINHHNRVGFRTSATVERHASFGDFVSTVITIHDSVAKHNNVYMAVIVYSNHIALT